MSDEHRDKAVEAVRRSLLESGWSCPDRGPDDPERDLYEQELASTRAALGRALDAADKDLELMYFERFKEAVLSAEAVEAGGARLPGSEHDTAEDWARETIEAALSKAQQLMEEGQ